MAIYKKSSTGAVGTLPSVIIDLGSAFALDSVLADTLIVDAGSFLISNDPAAGSAGADLANTGAWAAAINGIVIGTNGIVLAAGNTATSTIAVGKTASVTGADNHGIAARSSVAINNSGSIVGTVNGVSIEGGAANSIANSGSIIGASHAIFDFSGLSNDTVSSSGLISGDVDLAGGTNTLTNSGSITGRLAGGTGNDSFTNKKTISGHVELGAGTNRLDNSGSIGADGGGVSVRGGATGSDSVTNSGKLLASISLLAGTNAVLNSGTVGMDTAHRSFAGGSGADIVTNKGTLLGGVDMAAGVNKLINYSTVGKLTGTPAIEGASYAGSINADAVSNSGKLLGAINAGDGANSVVNAGSIGVDINGDSIITGTGADAITNAARMSTKVGTGGTIFGDVVTGDGNDTVSNFITFKYFVGTVSTTVTANGQIRGLIDLGNGNDTFNGGAFAETVKDGNGGDIYRLGGGNDRYVATGAAANLDSYDLIDGGAGVLDVYDARAALSDGVIINLDTLAHSETSSGIGTTAAMGNRAYGTDVAGQPPSSVTAPYDTITNFERALGTQFADVIFGSGFANELAGNGGDDHLWGLGGNDLLNGGTGTDAVIGGAGADTLAGGAGDDTFWYFSVSDSGITSVTHDLIVDFAGGAGGDVIDLTKIDANSKVAGNDAFKFIGTNVGWRGTAGELRAVWSTIGQIIEGDVNGDKIADFSIAIIDVGHTIGLSNLSGVDFVL